MRSQVQVLAGPPPIVAGQSAAGSELGALVAGLGRAGAARPSPPAPPLAPPGPPTRPSGSATTTQRGQAPSRGRQPRGGCRHLALQPAPRAHRAAARDGLRAPAWPAWSLRGQARPPRPAPNPAAGSATDPPDQRDLGSVARVSASATVVEPSTARQLQGPPPVPVVRVARPPRPGPQRHRLSMGGDGRVRTDEGGHRTAGHRTAGHRTAGHRTAGQQPSERRTLWTTTPGDRTPDGWTAGSRTPNPDGWTPPAGHRRPTPWRACWPGRPRRPRPTPRERLDAPLGRRRLGEQPPGPLRSKDAGAPTPLRTGLATAATSAAGGTPPSSWRLGALLSCVGFGWYEGRAMGLRKGEGCGVMLVRKCSWGVVRDAEVAWWGSMCR
jgi:hypothetical protein